MGFLINLKDSGFFKELNTESRKEYLGLTRDKIVSAIDNIYYTLFLEDDINENEKLTPLLKELEMLKDRATTSHVEQDFCDGLQIDVKSYKLYKYCLTCKDLYDIFILSYLPNTDTPRILVQIRAYGLWLHGAEKMLSDSLNHVKLIFESFGCKIVRCRENRIDYCYHTNIILNPEKVLSDKNINNQLHTSMQKWGMMGDIEKNNGNIVLKKDYFSLGERKSNNIFIRIYNKGLEVIEMGYKGFFFEIWYKKGLINMYDKYCLEYALQEKNYDYVHKAKLHFYLTYGTDENRKQEYKLALKDTNMTLDGYKNLARKYMPEITTVMNVEYQTQRKFYYYSDDFIDMLKFIPREGVPNELNRIFRIIDNKAVFLDYLTSATMSFKKDENEYSSWWQRLRNTKLEGLNLDESLIREYSSNLDERLAKAKFINSVGTVAVYNDNVETDFISDISDALSNLNDNHKHNVNLIVLNEDGEFVNDYYSDLLFSYHTKKVIKEKRLKNRKKKINK